MPKGGSGFQKAAASAADGLIKGPGGRTGYVENAEAFRKELQSLYESMYRSSNNRYYFDDKGNVKDISMETRDLQRVYDLAKRLSIATVEYDRNAKANYENLRSKFRTHVPVFMDREDANKSIREQFDFGHFKVRTNLNANYKIGKQTISGADLRNRGSMRERFADALGEHAVADVYSRHGQGAPTQKTFLDEANRRLNEAKARIHVRRRDTSFADSYRHDIVEGYKKIYAEAQSRRKQP